MRRNRPVLITDAPEDQELEIRRRERRYVAMMLLRAVCVIAGALFVAQKPPLWQVWAILCVAGMVLLPWFAVILANDRPPKKRAPVRSPAAHHASGPPALPASQQRVAEEHQVIDEQR